MNAPNSRFEIGFDDNENDRGMDSILKRISRIQVLDAKDKNADLEPSLFGKNSDLSDSSDCEDELFGHTDNDNSKESKKGIIDYSKEKCELFPEAANIQGSIVKQSIEARDYKQAKEYIERLDSIPVEKHGFNTLVVEIKYLLFDPYNNEKQIRDKISVIKKMYPAKEDSLYFEGILENRLGNIDKSMNLFRKAVGKCKTAPCSAEFLTYEMLKAGEFEETIKYADLAITMSAYLEPVIDVAKVCYSKCLAQDALLCKRIFAKEEVSVEEINSVRILYESLKKDFPSLRGSNTINNRISVLNMLKLAHRE